MTISTQTRLSIDASFTSKGRDDVMCLAALDHV